MRRLGMLLVILASTTSVWAASAKEDAKERLQKAGEVLQEIMGAPDKGIPAEDVEGAKCIAVVPHMVKG